MMRAHALLLFVFSITLCAPALHVDSSNATAIVRRMARELSSPLSPRNKNILFENADRFLRDIRYALTTSEHDILTLANKKSSLGLYEPPNLVSLDKHAPPLVLQKFGMKLRANATFALARMAHDAASQGIVLIVGSAYRSYAYQARLFKFYSARLGSKEAERLSARPGTSQHQLGLAIDFGTIDDSFTGTPAERWLAQNAWKYGYSLSYPPDQEQHTGYRHESWHYRYLGLDVARLERTYFGNNQHHTLAFLQAYLCLTRTSLL